MNPDFLAEQERELLCQQIRAKLKPEYIEVLDHYERYRILNDYVPPLRFLEQGGQVNS